MKELAIALIFDGLMTQLPDKLLKRPYTQKIAKAIRRKNLFLHKQDPKKFEEAYQLAEAIGEAVEVSGNDYASITGALEHLYKKANISDIYKLNEKHLSKLFNATSKDGVHFQTARFVNTILREADIEYTYRMYNG